ncbi:MAG: peptide chain release factor-like protein [Planctomycetota bacterium]
MSGRVDRRKLAGEIEVHTYRSRGPGGRKRNTSESAVRIRHVPTGITAVGTESRSQARNRALALERLIVRLEARARKPKKRVPTRPTRASREHALAEKKRRAAKKRLRGSVQEE